MLARDQLGKVAPLLRLGAVAPKLVDAEIGVRPVRQSDRGRAARDLFHGHAMLEIAHPGAAVFLLDRDPEQSEPAELGPQLPRKLVGVVDLVGPRRDPVGGEALHAVAERIDVLAETEIEASPSVGDHDRSPIAAPECYRWRDKVAKYVSPSSPRKRGPMTKGRANCEVGGRGSRLAAAARP